jgi:hypothetical protein
MCEGKLQQQHTSARLYLGKNTVVVRLRNGYLRLAAASSLGDRPSTNNGRSTPTGRKKIVPAVQW